MAAYLPAVSVTFAIADLSEAIRINAEKAAWYQERARLYRLSGNAVAATGVSVMIQLGCQELEISTCLAAM
jgi:hypothetical protein